VRSETVKALAAECGFELCGIAGASPVPDLDRFETWLGRGYAGEMRYLTDHRAQVRADLSKLLATVQSVICVGKLYNAGPQGNGISRYAQSTDYHLTMKAQLEQLAERLLEVEPFDHKICVDTAPLLERSFARQAGLGWIGKNTCLINEPRGSWFFLGEILTSLKLAPAAPPPDRCGTCSRCIDACPTQALVPAGDGWALDARRCISYLTIELRGEIPDEFHAGMGANVFGCDICQEVCPWNSGAPLTGDPAFEPLQYPQLSEDLTEEQFRAAFGKTPVARTKYSGLMRNLRIAGKNRKSD
jgi:epoxyqueuosine reductase